MIRLDDQTSHQHILILSYLLQSVVIQWIMSDQICKMSDQKEDLKGRMSFEWRRIVSSTVGSGTQLKRSFTETAA